MKKYKAASILMIIHGGVMEIGGILFLIALLLMGADKFGGGQNFSFIVSYFQKNLYLMMFMGVIRIIGAVGLWKNRMRGLVLSVINCVVTMVLMMFMLPAGIVDVILACTALVLILLEYFGNKEINQYSSAA